MFYVAADVAVDDTATVDLLAMTSPAGATGTLWTIYWRVPFGHSQSMKVVKNLNFTFLLSSFHFFIEFFHFSCSPNFKHISFKTRFFDFNFQNSLEK